MGKAKAKGGARLKIKDAPTARIEAFRQIMDEMSFNGIVVAEHYKRRKSGSLRKVWDDLSHNLITNDGMNSLLGVHYDGVTQITSWYMALINNSPSPTLLVTNTSSTGSRNWVEYSDYDEAARPEWEPTISSRTATNGTTVDFTFNESVTIYGIFLISVSTKGGTTGTMNSCAAFSAPRAVENTDVLKVTYSIAG